jgi:hypothetical protein
MCDTPENPDANLLFALRNDGRSITLVELEIAERLGSMTPVSAETAREWVLAGRLHETGLWIDWIDVEHRKLRVVRYAEPE